MDDMSDLIQDYLRGALEIGRSDEVAKMIDADPQWKKEYDFQVSIKEASSLIEQDRIVEMLKDHEGSTEQESQIFLKWGIIGLIVIALFVAVYLFNRPKLEVSGGALYATYYEPLPNRIAPTTRQLATDSLTIAFKYYDEGQYEEAFNTLSNLNSIEIIKPIELYKAVCLMELGAYQKSLDLLSGLALDEEPWRTDMLWYQALTQIRLDKIEESIGILDIIVNNEGSHEQLRVKARKLREGVKKIEMHRK